MRPRTTFRPPTWMATRITPLARVPSTPFSPPTPPTTHVSHTITCDTRVICVICVTGSSMTLVFPYTVFAAVIDAMAVKIATIVKDTCLVEINRLPRQVAGTNV